MGPREIAIDSANNVYVKDSVYSVHHIQKFTSSGVFLDRWNHSGTANGQWRDVSGIAIDSVGNVYMIDSLIHRVQEFSSSGAFLAKWGSYGSDDGQFMGFEAIAIDSTNKVYVLEDNRIQKFGCATL